MICIWLGSMSYQITVTGISSASATDYLICAISEPISLLKSLKINASAHSFGPYNMLQRHFIGQAKFLSR